MAPNSLFNLLLLFLVITGGRSAQYFYFTNQCSYTLWLAASPGIGDAMPERGPHTIYILSMPEKWTGSIWVRTKCSADPDQHFTCETGDCGSGTMDCQSPPPKYPVTLLNFDINQTSVSYEVSLNHGYNGVPVSIDPVGGHPEDYTGECPTFDCVQDINKVCPPRLVARNRKGGVVGCFSPCDGFKDPRFCCTGGFGGPACKPNEYSRRFKQVCPMAHTYPGDRQPIIRHCEDAQYYNITFCP